MTIKVKLTLLSIVGLLLLGTAITVIAVNQSTSALLEAEFNKLTTVEAAKKNEISNYMNSLKGLLISLTNSEITHEAFIDFEKGFYKLDEELKLDINTISSKLKNDFQANYLDSVNYDVPNSEQKKDIADYLPTNKNAITAQYIFITDNKEKLGEKNSLTYNAKYKSTYMDAHKKYHLTYDKYLNSFELYDIFMVDLKGNLIYTDFKEKDFATNLKTGIYANTGIGKVFAKAAGSQEGTLAFEDFKPYEPSYNSAASFIASPIFIQGVKKGVLIFQMPVDRINSVMSFDGNYKASGLGESGEVYLVGEDFKMRNNSRFVSDIKDKVVQDLGSTIGVWKIDTQSTRKVFQDKSSQTGKWIIPDYRGVNVLSVYNKIDLYGQATWAIISEIDEEEALLPAIKLQNLIAMISIGIIVVVSLIMLFFINSVIIKPLNTFQDGILGFFKYLNKESNEVSDLIVNGKDEIGTMSTLINENIAKIQKGLEEEKALISNASEVINAVNSGDLKNRISLDSSNKGLNDLKDLINSMLQNLDNNISNILNVLSEYANYNYLHTVDKANLKGEMAELISGINNLDASITDMLKQNKQAGLSLQTDANFLLNNVSTLTTSSNEAAASLEETAAALEEITSIVIANTENIHKMSNYANELTQSVEKGHNLANKTTNSMEEINEQVNAINDAISVIDQIAFQTNILSLNAAVEAATAGEAGKGFAVVAQEVRNLASRSAEAANDIKKIVETATVKANEGKTISSTMIEGYGSLNENISKTISLINSISAASKEQQSGVEQINDAVNQLDHQTQKNAAIATQTKDIAEGTNELARGIVDDANQKEFEGKDDVKAQVKDYDTIVDIPSRHKEHVA